MDKIDDYLHSIYFDPNHPIAFTGIDKLYRFVKADGRNISKSRISKWLSGQPVYSEHKAARKNFKKLRVIVPRKLYQLDMDCVSMTRYAKVNNGFAHILVIIDVMSKFCWTYPLKTLQAKEMVGALEKTIGGKKIENIRSDSGSEFVNGSVKKFMKSHDINHFLTSNIQKANFAERVIRTLKNRLTRYMHQKNSHKWVEVLPKITLGYNSTFHRSIGMSPTQALTTDDSTLWKKLYDPPKLVAKKETSIGAQSRSPYKFNVGDTVKLSSLNGTFAKDYDAKWTAENFIITERFVTQGISQYSVKTWNNVAIKGHFYGEELQKITLPEGDDTVYKVESVLRRRTRKGQKQVYVKWEGWNKSYNSWLPETELHDI